MRSGITMLFSSFVFLLLAHAAAVQTRETMLCALVGEGPLVSIALGAGLAGVVLGALGAASLDRWLRDAANASQTSSGQEANS